MEFKNRISEFLIFCLFLLSFILVPVLANSAELYFDADVGDGGDGSKASPYNEFSDYTFNLNSLSDGDIIYLIGDLGHLDLSGVTNDPTIMIKPYKCKKVTLTGLTPHGTPANITFNLFRGPCVSKFIQILE